MNGAWTHPEDLLSALLDDELDATTSATVEDHLSGCAACRREVAEIEQTRRSLRELPPVPAPAGLGDRLVDRRRRASRWGIVVSLAAGVAALAGSVAVSNPDKAVSPDEPVAAESGSDDRPLSIRRGSHPDDSDPSLLEQAEDAARDLLGFLAG